MVIYLAERALFAFTNTVYHWYIGGFRFFANVTINTLRAVDRFFAIKINAFHIFQPLYQDRTFIGYFFGFFVRFFKIVSGGLVFAAITVLALAFYVCWALTPIYLILMIFNFR